MSIAEIGLSFVEGLALIASPCILPVLPLVLSSSIEGGKRRPFGIITGFVIAFSAFALLSRQLVLALNINLDVIKYGSLVLLAAFGLILLSEKLSHWFSLQTQKLANLGGGWTGQGGSGFFSGVVIGMLIGLVWTPCAGPILAAVLVQIIREQSNLQALLLVMAFALGAGAPMLAIALTGRKLMSRLGFFTRHAESVRKGFGIIILLAVGFIASGADVQNLFAENHHAPPAQAAGLQDALPQPYPAPEFAGIESWLNSPPLTMASLKGKAVLVDFWTYSCINCVRTLPYLTKWDADYRDKGLVIIGVHAPEFEFEKSRANVEAALATRGIHYPVALDNHLDTWTAFHNQYWPAHYLIDQKGQVVSTHYGEGHYAETEHNIRYLLGLSPDTDEKDIPAPVSQNQTPETYLGVNRAARFAGAGPLSLGTHVYGWPRDLATHHWALQGKWRIAGDRIISQQADAALRLNFTAGKVFLVLGTTGQPIHATVALNGVRLTGAAGKDDPGGALTVGRHTLYELVNQGQVAQGLLEIKADAPGLEAYAFTFGD